MKTQSTFFYLLFTICTNINITANAQAVNVQDSLGLVDLYNSTNGPSWYHHEYWLTGHPVTTWYGITVTDTRVTGIYLVADNLDGNIPASIGKLVNLTTLDLGGDENEGIYNQLRGSIPSSIGNLVNLTLLDLNLNKLSGTIPSSLGNLVNLTTLGLGYNQLSGSIPSSLGNLVNLGTLSLGNNQLSGTIPSSLGNLVNLNYLHLFFNQLSGSIPSSLGNLVNLVHLGLHGNQLSGSILPSLGNLVNLSYLTLSNNKLSGSIPSSLGNLVNLGTLSLGNNQLSGTIPSWLGNLVNLYALDLGNNQLSGSIPSSLGNLAGLQQLYLYNNQLSGTIPPSLGKLANLLVLDFSHNKLSGKIPASIVNLQSQPYLYLSYNRFTFNGMELVAQRYSYGAYYDNQARIPIHQIGNALSVSVGGTLSNNTYRWCEVGKSSLIHIKTIKGDSVFHPSHSGEYVVAVTNSIARQLTLYSNKFTYTAPAILNEIATTSSENSMRQGAKTNLFFVYPNPGKDIFHVQTNGNAALTLTDQSGKILLTKTIYGKGEINVANFAAGLYFLKNNATGAVKKVVVSK